MAAPVGQAAPAAQLTQAMVLRLALPADLRLAMVLRLVHPAATAMPWKKASALVMSPRSNLHRAR